MISAYVIFSGGVGLMGPLGEALEEAFKTGHSFAQVHYITRHAALAVQNQNPYGQNQSSETNR